MKKCAPPASYRFLSVFVVVACGAAAFLAFCQLFYGGQSPVVCAIMGLLFGSAAFSVAFHDFQERLGVFLCR